MQTPRPKAGGWRSWLMGLIVALLALGLSTSSQNAYAVSDLALIGSTPANGALNVGLNDPIVITFNYEVDLAKLAGNLSNPNLAASQKWVRITPDTAGGAPINLFPTSTSGFSRTVTLTHVPFDASTLYAVEVDTSANALGAWVKTDTRSDATPKPNPFSFTTEDPRGPYIVSHSPINGQTNVPAKVGDQSNTIQVVFNKPVNPASLQVELRKAVAWDGNGNPTAFELVAPLSVPAPDDPANPVVFTFRNLNLQESKSQVPGPLRTSYQVAVVAAKDFSGRDLRANPVSPDDNGVKNPWVFHMKDGIRPKVALLEPSGSNIDPMAPIIVTFDEPMDLNSVLQNAGGNALLRAFTNGNDIGVAFTPEVVADTGNTKFRFTHTVPFASEQTIQVQVQPNANVKDVASLSLDVNPDAKPSTTFTIINAQPPTITSASPADDPAGLNRVSLTPTIVLSFSKPMDPESFSTSGNSKTGGVPNIALIRVDNGNVVPLNTLQWNTTNTQVTITPSQALVGGPTSYKLQIGDRNAVDLQTGNITNPDQFNRSLPMDSRGIRLASSAALGTDFALSMTTADTTAPRIVNVTPRNGAVNVPLNPEIRIEFSDSVKIDGGAAPLIELRYAAQDVARPTFTNANSGVTQLAPGFARADKPSGWSVNAQGTPNTVLTIRPDTLANGGQTLSVRVTNAQDAAGNGAGQLTAVSTNNPTEISNPFQFDLIDTSPFNVVSVRPGTDETPHIGDVYGLRTPIVLTFSKAVNDQTIYFSVPKALDPSGWTDATAVTDPAIATDATRNYYRVNPGSGAFSNGFRRVTLVHNAFAANSNFTGANTINLVAGLARDLVGGAPLNAGDAAATTASFRTGTRPVVTSIQYEIPGGPKEGGGNTALNPDGTLNGHTNVFSGANLETNGWRDLSDVAFYGDVPRNARIRVVFNQQMNTNTVPFPSFLRSPAGEDLGWHVAWFQNNTVAVYSHDQNFTGASVNGLPGRVVFSDDTPKLSSIPYWGFVLGSGRDLKGDDLLVGSARLTNDPTAPVQRTDNLGNAVGANTGTLMVSPYDTVKPQGINPNEAVTVEYLTNPGEADQGKWVWAPLTGGSTNIPATTRIRVTANEALEHTTGSPDHGEGVEVVRVGDITDTNPDFNSRIGLTLDSVQDVNVGQTDVNRNRQVFTLAHPFDGSFGQNTSTGRYRDNNGAVVQELFTYRLGFIIRDRSLVREKDADVDGNSNSRSDITLTPADKLPPVLSRVIFGNGSGVAGTMKPTDNITLRFSEPVKPETVTIVNRDGDSLDLTGITRITPAGTPTTDVVFSHDPLPTSADEYKSLRFQVKGVKRNNDDAEDVEDAAGNGTSNPAYLNDTNVNVGARQGDAITVNATADTVPPTVQSVQVARDFFVAQFDRPMMQETDTSKTTRWDRSVFNKANYEVVYAYDVVENNQVVRKTNTRTADDIQSILYDDATRAVRVTLKPDKAFVLPAGASNESVTIRIKGTIGSRIGNQMGSDYVRTFTAIDPGRSNWRIGLEVETVVPGLAPGDQFVAGVQYIANTNVDGFNAGLDIPHPPVIGGQRGNVQIGNVRTDAEFGAGNGDYYTVDIQGPLSAGSQTKTWGNVQVRITGLGNDLVPPMIRIKPNLQVSGAELPSFYVAELQEVDTTAIDASTTGTPDGVKSYDLRDPQVQANGIRFPAVTTDPNGNVTKTFRLLVHTPRIDTIEFAQPGFNLVALPLRPVNPAVEVVLFGVNPVIAYRYNTSAQRYDTFTVNPNFTTMETGRGYWVRPNSTQNPIQVYGTPNVGSQTLPLSAGWNLIGNPFPNDVSSASFRVRLKDGSEVPIATALSDASYGLDSSFVTYNGTTPVDVELGTGIMQAKKGYWVFLTETTPISALVIPPPVP